MRLQLFLTLPLIVAYSATAQHMTRNHPENELLAQPAIHITVGQKNADIIGKDNRALQAAVDYVGQLGGGIVEVGPGEYLMHDSLHMRSRVTLRGAGEKTVLKKAPSVRSLLLQDGDFGEESVTLVNADEFKIGHGVYIATNKVNGFHTICATILNKKDNYLTLSRPLNADCMVADEAYIATIFPVISAYHVEKFRIENITINGNRDNNEYINGCRGAGIFFYQGDGAVMDNCIVRNFAGDGISFQQSNDVQLLNSHVENCAGGGIHPGSGAQRPVIRGCTSTKNDRDGFFFCWRVRNGVVEDNSFSNNGGVGISIGHKDSDNIIRNNQINENAAGGVYWRPNTQPMSGHRNVLSNNTIENNRKFGLSIEDASTGTIIKENTITQNDSDSIAIRIGAETEEVTIESNTIRAKQQVVDNRKTP